MDAPGFAVAVTLPRAGNIGGGFTLLHIAEQNRTIALDLRETSTVSKRRQAAHRSNAWRLRTTRIRASAGRAR